MVAVVTLQEVEVRNKLYTLSFKGEGLVNSPFYPIASYAFSVVPALSGRQNGSAGRVSGLAVREFPRWRWGLGSGRVFRDGVAFRGGLAQREGSGAGGQLGTPGPCPREKTWAWHPLVDSEW